MWAWKIWMAAVAIGVVGLGYGEWRMWRRVDARLDAVSDRIDAVAAGLDREVSDGESDFHKLSTRIESVELLASRVETLEIYVASVRRSTSTTVYRASVTRPAPVPSPTANWWCWFGRECYRTDTDCIRIAGTNGRDTAECKAFGRAWCGGIDGKACFVTAADCENENAKLFIYGNQGSASRPCIALD